MRPIPELKSTQHLLKLGRKDLSDKNVVELQKLADELDRVQDEDRPKALLRQGLIYTYLNNLPKAIDCFFQSYQIDPNESAFINYLFALQNNGEAELAIEKGLNYLLKNPNNVVVFETVISILHFHKDQEKLDALQKFITYHENKERYKTALIAIQTRYNFIDELALKSELFNKVSACVNYECQKIFFNNNKLGSLCSLKKNCIHIKVINLPDYDDISLLNRNFDQAIQREIEKGNLDFDDYIDSLDKLVVGFRANPDARVA